MISNRLFFAAALGLASAISATGTTVTVLDADGNITATGDTLSAVSESIVDGNVIQIGADYTESGQIYFDNGSGGATEEDISITIESDTAGTVRKIDTAANLTDYYGTGTLTITLRDIEIGGAKTSALWAYGNLHIIGDNAIFRGNANTTYLGTIYNTNTISISGTTTFCDNWNQRSEGPVIFARCSSEDGTTIRDGVIFNGAGSVSTFYGNTSGESHERAFDVWSFGGNVIITDTGTYSFGGGIRITEDYWKLAGALKINGGANVTFGENAVNDLAGDTEISDKGTNVVFNNANDANTFAGNFTAIDGVNVEFLGGGALTVGGTLYVGSSWWGGGASTLSVLGKGDTTSVNADILDIDSGSSVHFSEASANFNRLVLRGNLSLQNVDATISDYANLFYGLSLTLDGSSLTFADNSFSYGTTITLTNDSKISSSASELLIGGLTEGSTGTIETTSENSVLQFYGTNTLGAMTLNAGAVRNDDGEITDATGTLKLGCEHRSGIGAPTLGAGSVINAKSIQFGWLDSDEVDLSAAEINFVETVSVAQSMTLKTAKNFTGENALTSVSLSAAGTLENTGDMEITDALLMSYDYTDWDGNLKTTGNLTISGKISTLGGGATADGVIQAANVTIDLTKQGSLALSDELSILAKTLDDAGTLGNITFTGTANNLTINSALTAKTLTVGASDAEAGTTKIVVAASALDNVAATTVNAGGALTVSGDWALSEGKALTLTNGTSAHVEGALSVSGGASVNVGPYNAWAGTGLSARLSATDGITVSGNDVTVSDYNVTCALYGGRGFVAQLETTGEGADIVFENNSGYGIYANGVKLVSSGDIIFNGNSSGAITTYVHGGWYCGGAELYADGNITLATRNDSVDVVGGSGYATVSASGDITINARRFAGHKSTTFESGNVIIGSYDASGNDEGDSTVTMSAYWGYGIISFKEATTLTVNEGWTLYVDADALDVLGKTTLAGTLDLSFQHNDKINLADLALLGGATIYSKCTESDDGATVKIGSLAKSEDETDTATVEVVRGGISVGAADAWSVALKAGTDAEKPGSGAIALGADSASAVNLHASSLSASGTLTVNGAAVLDNGTTVSVAGTNVAADASLKFVGNVSGDNAFGETISVGKNASLEIDGAWTLTADSTVTNAGTLTVNGATIIDSGATLSIVGNGDGNTASLETVDLLNGNLSLSNGANVSAGYIMSESVGSISVDASKLTVKRFETWHFAPAITLSNDATISVTGGGFYLEPMMSESSENILTVNGTGTIETLGETSQIYISGVGNTIALNGKLTLSAGVTKDENGNVTDATGTLYIYQSSSSNPAFPSYGENLVVNAGTLQISNYSGVTVNLTGTEFNILKNINVARGSLQTGGNAMSLESAKIGQYGESVWENYASVEISDALKLGKNADSSVTGTLRAVGGDIVVSGAIIDITESAAARGTLSANNVTIDISSQTQALTDTLNLVAKSTDESGTETLGDITFTGTRDGADAYEIAANLTAARLVIGDENAATNVAMAADKLSGISEVVVNGADILSVSGDLSLQKLSLSQNGRLVADGNLEIATLSVDTAGILNGENITLGDTIASDGSDAACKLTVTATGTLALTGTNALKAAINAETLEVSGTTNFTAQKGWLTAETTTISGTLNIEARNARLGDVSVLKTGTLAINGVVYATDIYSKAALEIGEYGKLNVEGDVTTKTLALNGGKLSADGEILVTNAIENATGKISGAEIMLLGGISGTAELEAAGTLTLVGDSTVKSATANVLEVAGNARFDEVSVASTNISGVMTLDGSAAGNASSLGEISGAGTLVLSGKTTVSDGVRFAANTERTRAEIASGAEITTDVYFSETGSTTLAVNDATLNGNITFTGTGNTLELDGAALTGTLFVKNTDLTIATANSLRDIAVSAGTLTMACTGAFGDDATQIALTEGAHLKIGTGVELNAISVLITLNEAYLSEAAILFESSLMRRMLLLSENEAGLTIRVEGDDAALGLLFESSDVGFKLFDPALLSATDIQVELSESLQTELNDRGLEYNVISGVFSVSVPEPSAFGLLAGTLALALAASRRKRERA